MRLFWLIACLSIAASTVAAEDVAVNSRYYDVTGESLAEIWRDMRAKAPVGHDGSKYNANTRWYVRWRYPYLRSAGGCTTGPVTVTLTITYTLPRWDRPRGASAKVANQWDRYIEALEKHEDGHADFGRQAARKIERSLEALPRQSSCEAVAAIANETGRQILDDVRPEEREYDRSTNHGATQGTGFFRDLAEGRTTSR